MNTKTPPWHRAALPLTISFAAGMQSLPALAVSFNMGEIEGQFDSSLSVGAGWSTSDRDAKLLNSASADDGRRNFKKGETFSKVFKGVHDLELKYGDSGVFVRGKYWYDFELKDEHRLFKDIDDTNRKEGAKSAGAEILDAFIYHNYMIRDLPGTVRLGKQVVSWGESTFISGGINSINPVDVASFRRPGAEIKEGLIPVNMFYLSQNLTENVSAEAFYQLEWDQTVLDNCGTFFSQIDVMADGCGGLFAGPDLTGSTAAKAALKPFGINMTSEGIEMPRSGDRDARDGGQWGAALHWFAPELDSEFGAYFMNYHSRQAYFSVAGGAHMADTGFAQSLCGNLGIGAGGCGAFLSSDSGQSLAQGYRLGSSHYYAEYPEDIRLYGLSFSTSLSTGTTLSGEISYRPNMPIQINAVDLVTAVVGESSLTPVLSSGAVALTNNSVITGYRRKEVTQAQVTATHFFDQVLGAERLTLVGEVGVTHIAGLEGKGGLRYGRSTSYGQGALADNSLCTGTTNTEAPQNCDNNGFATPTSWGYRVRAALDYNDVIPGVALRPNLAWSHDVSGYGPEPGFNEGSKAISLGLDATYLNTYNASLSYTNYFGGAYNVNVDRDFLALSFGVSF